MCQEKAHPQFKITIDYGWLLIAPPMFMRKVFVIMLQLVINNSFIQCIQSFTFVYFSRSVPHFLTPTTNLQRIPIIGCVKIRPFELKKTAC